MADLREVAALRRQAEEAYAAAINDEYRALVETLVAARKAAGLTAQQIADASGVSRPQITNVETGKMGASPETLLGYAAALGGRLVFQEGQ